MWKRTVVSVGVLMGAGLLLAGPAPAQQKSGRPPPRFLQHLAEARMSALAGATSLSLAVGNEVEPNDDAGNATPAAIGDTISGAIDPLGDGDYFSVFLAAGTELDADIDAQWIGSSLDATLALYAPDGVSVIQWNDDWDGLDSRIRQSIGEDGTYFLEVRSLGDYCGGPECYYNLNIGTWTPPPPPPPGPGDPTTLISSGFQLPAGFRSGPDGALFVADYWASRIWRLGLDGSLSPFAEIPNPFHVAFDGYGDLLVAADPGVLLKVTPQGQVSEFITDFYYISAIAVDRLGEIWIAGEDDQGYGLRHYEPSGQLVERRELGYSLGHMAFGPSGHLIASTSHAILRFEGTGVSEIIVDPEGCCIHGFAIDQAGTYYVVDQTGAEWTNQVRIVHYGSDGSVLADPFADVSESASPLFVTFGRNANGAPNARLFFTLIDWNTGTGEVREVNPAGVTAPGWNMWPSLLAVLPSSLPDGMLGYDYEARLELSETGLNPAWTVTSGSLPTGLSFDPVTGRLGAYPTALGSFTFRVRAEAGERMGEREFTITVREPSMSRTDAADGLLGGSGAMETGQERCLDLMGNRNGSFDVGDWRAFLQREGLLPAVVTGSVRP